MTIIIKGRPITKKNSQRIVSRAGTVRTIPSAAFEKYQEDAGWQLSGYRKKIDYPVNLKCVYYMPTRGLVDLVNLLEGTCDILVHYGVLADDNSRIVASHDGSRCLYDKDNPRVEITIEEVQDDTHEEPCRGGSGMAQKNRDTRQGQEHLGEDA